MITVENFAQRAEIHHRSGSRTTLLAFAGVGVALAAAAAAFVVEGGGANAARVAADMAFRTAGVAFLFFYLAGPLARLIPSAVTAELRRERGGLAFAFVGAYAAFLACVLAPDYLTSGRIPLPALTLCVLSTIVAAALMASVLADRQGQLDRSAWRAMESVAVAFFWLTFAFDDLEHLYGPHRADNYHGLFLSLLVVALLIRFADAFVLKRRAAMAEKAA